MTSTALVRSEIEGYTKKGEKRRTLFHNVKHKRKKVDVDRPHVAVVKVQNGVTISMGYQAVRLDVGVDLPVGVRLGNTDDLREGFDKAFDFVEDELMNRSKDLDSLLQKLARKYR